MLYLTVWGVEPVVTHQTAWFESTPCHKGEQMTQPDARCREITNHVKHPAGTGTTQKRKEKTAPFSVNEMRRQVSHRAVH